MTAATVDSSLQLSIFFKTEGTASPFKLTFHYKNACIFGISPGWIWEVWLWYCICQDDCSICLSDRLMLIKASVVQTDVGDTNLLDYDRAICLSDWCLCHLSQTNVSQGVCCSDRYRWHQSFRLWPCHLSFRRMSVTYVFQTNAPAICPSRTSSL